MSGPIQQRQQQSLGAAKADYRIIEYPGAVHAFTNPEATELGKKFNLPLRYDAKVDQEAKAEASKFNKQKNENGPDCPKPSGDASPADGLMMLRDWTMLGTTELYFSSAPTVD